MTGSVSSPRGDAPLTPAQFQRAADVSRETMDRLVAFHDHLLHWQRRINLIAPSTVDDIWRRHFLDSAQLAAHIPKTSPGAVDNYIVDIGSGAGFPGIILSLLGVEPLHLVESNQRKAAFLTEAVRQLGLAATVHRGRVEDLGAALGGRAAVVVARAVADLPALLDYAAPLLAPGGSGLFPKGRRWRDEVTEARRGWSFELTTIDSATDPEGKILMVSGAVLKARKQGQTI